MTFMVINLTTIPVAQIVLWFPCNAAAAWLASESIGVPITFPILAKVREDNDKTRHIINKKYNPINIHLFRYDYIDNPLSFSANMAIGQPAISC